MENKEFLEQHIFIDLKNLNDGFDSEGKAYFSEADFEIVLERIKKFGIGMYTLETRLKGELHGSKGHLDYNKKATDPKWCKKAYIEFKMKQPDLLYAGTYKISPKLLSRTIDRTAVEDWDRPVPEKDEEGENS